MLLGGNVYLHGQVGGQLVQQILDKAKHIIEVCLIVADQILDAAHQLRHDHHDNERQCCQRCDHGQRQRDAASRAVVLHPTEHPILIKAKHRGTQIGNHGTDYNRCDMPAELLEKGCHGGNVHDKEQKDCDDSQDQKRPRPGAEAVPNRAFAFSGDRNLICLFGCGHIYPPSLSRSPRAVCRPMRQRTQARVPYMFPNQPKNWSRVRHRGR